MPTIDVDGKFSVLLGEATIVKNHCKCPVYDWFPDGHITVQPHPLQRGRFRMVWAESQSYFSTGYTAFPEDQTCLETDSPILCNMTDEQSWCNGTWLMGVFQVDQMLVGFIHAEDAYKDMPNPDAKAWKSVGVCYSADYGASWSKPEQILRNPLPRASPPDWGGCGDFSVVRRGDEFFLFYTGAEPDGNVHPMVAKSSDRMGRPGTWSKWWEGSFSQPGLGGEEGTPETMKLDVAGSNPSVTWNSHLELWIMVWHAWGPPNVVLSSSPDLLQWHPGVRIVVEERATWYPTIIAEMGDVYCGRQARLYYSKMAQDEKPREFVGRDILFLRNGEEENAERYHPSKYSDPAYEPQCHPSAPNAQGFMYPPQKVDFYNQQQGPYAQQQCLHGQQYNPYGQQGPEKPPGGMYDAGAGSLLGACGACLCCCGLLDKAYLK